MNVKRNGISVTLVLLLGFVGLFSGIFISQHIQLTKKVDASKFHGTYLEDPRTVNQFSLTGLSQKSFDNASLQGHWTLMFFGFTNCGYVCPTTMAELSKMYRMLEKKGVKNLPQVVMISIDPDRDSIDKLEHYVHAFHPTFYGARGEVDAVKSMAREMGVAFEKVTNQKNAGPEIYDIQHTGAVMLFNPNGELNAFFTTPHYADLLVNDYLLLVS